jgi:hypothetical protein
LRERLEAIERLAAESRQAEQERRASEERLQQADADRRRHTQMLARIAVDLDASVDVETVVAAAATAGQQARPLFLAILPVLEVRQMLVLLHDAARAEVEVAYPDRLGEPRDGGAAPPIGARASATVGLRALALRRRPSSLAGCTAAGRGRRGRRAGRVGGASRLLARRRAAARRRRGAGGARAPRRAPRGSA